MRINKLPQNQVKALEKAFKSENNGKEKVRYQALWLLAQGHKRPFVAKLTGLSESSLRRFVTNYNKKGQQGLKNKPAKGNNYKLTKKQKLKIKNLISSNTPQKLGYKGKFWSIPLLKKLVKDKYSLKYKSYESYRKLFLFSGFSFHKPNKVNKRQNRGMIKRFEDNIKKNSKNTGEKIVWYW